mgnify:CR=1 FL=1
MTQEQRLKHGKGIATLQKLGILHEMPNLDGGQRVSPVFGKGSAAEDLPSWLDSDIRASKPTIPQNSAIQEDSVNLPLLLFVIGMVMLAGAGILFFFLAGR